MKKITADMLVDLGQAIAMAFSALYPTGLTIDEIERLSHERKWMKRIYNYLQEKGVVS